MPVIGVGANVGETIDESDLFYGGGAPDAPVFLPKSDDRADHFLFNTKEGQLKFIVQRPENRSRKIRFTWQSTWLSDPIEVPRRYDPRYPRVCLEGVPSVAFRGPIVIEKNGKKVVEFTESEYYIFADVPLLKGLLVFKVEDPVKEDIQYMDNWGSPPDVWGTRSVIEGVISVEVYQVLLNDEDAWARLISRQKFDGSLGERFIFSCADAWRKKPSGYEKDFPDPKFVFDIYYISGMELPRPYGWMIFTEDAVYHHVTAEEFSPERRKEWILKGN